jgi:hypothetical protein
MYCELKDMLHEQHKQYELLEQLPCSMTQHSIVR